MIDLMISADDLIGRVRRLLVVCLAAIAILASIDLVSAKGLDLGIGWHRLSEKTADWRGPEAGGRLASGQPLYSIGMFFNDFGDRHRARIGLRYSTHQTLHEVEDRAELNPFRSGLALTLGLGYITGAK